MSLFSPPICKEHKPSKLAASIEDGIRTVRVEVTKVTDVYDTQKAALDRQYVKIMKDTQRKFFSVC